jgi:hypothetical protein
MNESTSDVGTPVSKKFANGCWLRASATTPMTTLPRFIEPGELEQLLD